jgi:hypothetical protein
MLKFLPNVLDGVPISLEAPLYKEVAMKWGLLQSMVSSIVQQLKSLPREQGQVCCVPAIRECSAEIAASSILDQV